MYLYSMWVHFSGVLFISEKLKAPCAAMASETTATKAAETAKAAETIETTEAAETETGEEA